MMAPRDAANPASRAAVRPRRLSSTMAKRSDLNSVKKASSGKCADALLTRMVSNWRAGRLWDLRAWRTWRRRPGSGSWAGMTAETAMSMNAVMERVGVPAPPGDERPRSPPPREGGRAPRCGEGEDDEARPRGRIEGEIGPAEPADEGSAEQPVPKIDEIRMAPQVGQRPAGQESGHPRWSHPRDNEDDKGVRHRDGEIA